MLTFHVSSWVSRRVTSVSCHGQPTTLRRCWTISRLVQARSRILWTVPGASPSRSDHVFAVCIFVYHLLKSSSYCKGWSTKGLQSKTCIAICLVVETKSQEKNKALDEKL